MARSLVQSPFVYAAIKRDFPELDVTCVLSRGSNRPRTFQVQCRDGRCLTITLNPYPKHRGKPSPRISIPSPS
jgi:hypothetical protein